MDLHHAHWHGLPTGRLRPPYAGATYTPSFSDTSKSRISTQPFGDEVPAGAYKSYSRHRAYHNCGPHPLIGKCAALRQTLTCVEAAPDTLSDKPHMLRCHTLQSSDR